LRLRGWLLRLRGPLCRLRAGPLRRLCRRRLARGLARLTGLRGSLRTLAVRCGRLRRSYPARRLGLGLLRLQIALGWLLRLLRLQAALRRLPVQGLRLCCWTLRRLLRLRLLDALAGAWIVRARHLRGHRNRADRQRDRRRRQ
jgi:hypothetical protein